MKTIALSITFFFLLCFPALAREKPYSDVRISAVEGFNEAVRKSNQFAEKKEYGSAIEHFNSTFKWYI